ncbi:MAG TPA: amidohydrolase family protein [Burkholderiales bacterium]
MTGNDPGHVVPNSSGTDRPKTKAPANAADCHMHIYDPRAAQLASRLPVSDAGPPDYRLLQKRIGTSRVVVVQPRNHATNNQVTLDAVAQLGLGARGIAVLHPTVTDAELKRLDAGGIRGIRFSLGDPSTAVVTLDMVEPLAKRIAPLGWHVQLHWPGDMIAENADLLRRLPTPIVIDHMGRLPPAVGTAHPAYPIILGLIEKGRTWVKLGAAYLNTEIGPPRYPDATKIARAYVKAAPQRLVWGSDWPHPSEGNNKPDDALLFDLLAEWAGDEKTLNRVLVSNPEALYGFSAR